MMLEVIDVVSGRGSPSSWLEPCGLAFEKTNGGAAAAMQSEALVSPPVRNHLDSGQQQGALNGDRRAGRVAPRRTYPDTAVFSISTLAAKPGDACDWQSGCEEHAGSVPRPAGRIGEVFQGHFADSCQQIPQVLVGKVQQVASGGQIACSQRK